MDGSKLIMLVNTMEIRKGRLAEFRESVERAVRFTEEHGPQLIVNVYIDEDNMRAQSVQLYPDSDAILTHWELSDPYIKEVSENITVRRLQYFGQPDERVMNGVTPISREGVELTVTPHLTGYARFTEAAPSGE